DPVVAVARNLDVEIARDREQPDPVALGVDAHDDGGVRARALLALPTWAAIGADQQDRLRAGLRRRPHERSLRPPLQLRLDRGNDVALGPGMKLVEDGRRLPPGD